eukprot:Gb_01346 [translate_table: standard]
MNHHFHLYIYHKYICCHLHVQQQICHLLQAPMQQLYSGCNSENHLYCNAGFLRASFQDLVTAASMTLSRHLQSSNQSKGHGHPLHQDQRHGK